MSRAEFIACLVGLTVLWAGTRLISAAWAEVPPPTECRLIAHAGEDVEIYRCSGVDFFNACFVSASQLKGMAGGTQSSISCPDAR